jgi:hypothetical protein
MNEPANVSEKDIKLMDTVLSGLQPMVPGLVSGTRVANSGAPPPEAAEDSSEGTKSEEAPMGEEQAAGLASTSYVVGSVWLLVPSVGCDPDGDEAYFGKVVGVTDKVVEFQDSEMAADPEKFQLPTDAGRIVRGATWAELKSMADAAKEAEAKAQEQAK